ncbi:LLM class F420-dependent oxidoreductase [Rhodococcus sp. T2V]|uniref:LLM class F420-dependent oxidoreductase n=1 Tax=Rhodococcus sp. T2V TaxID=3034164 RepID=UPI0023E101BD|nr:LLM class F420-dependent oxidoreductase [Rhodococcus sp. T2V]MDF3308185.1 LLM class F420-dependent oxidoreductase [Rhodococcus sp. T2V]
MGRHLMLAGLQMFTSADSISPADLAAVAEQHGFESLFFPDHTHVPLGDGRSGYSGHDVPTYYRTVFDPVVAMSCAAQATSTIKVGTAVCLVTQRDPIILAKQVATIDHLSSGRVLLGVGAGWNDEEMRNHGADPTGRFRLLRERVEAMTAIWMQEEASYHGKLVDFDPMWSWPKPVQRPRPPVLVGGGGPTVLRRVVTFGDGWMPFRDGTDQVGDNLSGRVEDFEGALAQRIRELRNLAAEAGRGPLPVTLFNGCPHRAALDRYRDIGIDRVVFWLRTAEYGPTLEAMEALARLVQ